MHATGGFLGNACSTGGVDRLRGGGDGIGTSSLHARTEPCMASSTDWATTTASLELRVQGQTRVQVTGRNGASRAGCEPPISLRSICKKLTIAGASGRLVPCYTDKVVFRITPTNLLPGSTGDIRSVQRQAWSN